MNCPGIAHRLLALLLGCALATAQEAKEPPKPLPIAVTVKVEGVAVPRRTKDGTDTGVRNWKDRGHEWRIGDKTLAKPGLFALELKRIATDPASQRDSKIRPGEKELLPVVLEPDANVHWRDVMNLVDVLMRSGFEDFRLAGAGTQYFVPKAVAECVRDDGKLLVPRMYHNEPDDADDPLRREFEVHQDGRIVHDRRVIYRWQPGKADDQTDLRAALLAMRAADEQAGRIQERGPEHAKRLTGKVLIVADCFTEWRDVRRLMQALTAPDIGFWKFEIAAMEFAVSPRPEEAVGTGK